MMRRASLRLEVRPEQSVAFAALPAAYRDACNLLVPMVQDARCGNRAALHQLAFSKLRAGIQSKVCDFGHGLIYMVFRQTFGR
jgi:hypothetical protein